MKTKIEKYCLLKVQIVISNISTFFIYYVSFCILQLNIGNEFFVLVLHLIGINS